MAYRILSVVKKKRPAQNIQSNTIDSVDRLFVDFSTSSAKVVSGIESSEIVLAVAVEAGLVAASSSCPRALVGDGVLGAFMLLLVFLLLLFLLLLLIQKDWQVSVLTEAWDDCDAIAVFVVSDRAKQKLVAKQKFTPQKLVPRRGVTNSSEVRRGVDGFACQSRVDPGFTSHFLKQCHACTTGT